MLQERIQIPADIGDGTNSLGIDDETVGIATVLHLQDVLHQFRQNHRPRQIVVGHRGMTEVRGEQDLVIRLSWDDEFAIGQTAVLQCTVYHHVVFLVRQRLLLVLSHAESPALLIIRGDVGNPVWLVWHGIDMLQQLLTTHHLIDGQRVANDVQVGILEVDDLVAIQSVDATATDIPLLGNGPVEDRRTRGHLIDLDLRHRLTEHLQRLPEAVASDTATDGEHSTCQSVHRLSVLCSHAYQAVCPPSIMIFTPVTYFEASEERKIMAPTRSSG